MHHESFFDHSLIDFILAFISGWISLGIGHDALHAFTVAFFSVLAKELVVRVFSFCKQKFFDKTKSEK